MIGEPAQDLIQRVLQAYGGESKWRNATAVEAVVSCGGASFAMKWRKPFHRIEVFADVKNPYIRFSPINSKGHVAALRGESVQIETPNGTVLASRKEPRKLFPSGRRTLWWDDLDQAYFAGYALWNYLVFPALLLRNDIQWIPVSETILEARFPDHIPTHCRTQQFRFHPSTHLLLRHDYTAEVFGKWARASNQVTEHSGSEGVPFASRRRVTSRSKKGKVRRWPVLVWIEVHEWRLL